MERKRNENKPQHTPGPWNATFSGSGGYNCMTAAWRIEDATGGTITHVDLADYGQEYSGQRGDFSVAQANAALLAAGPEMLAALVAIAEAGDQPSRDKHLRLELRKQARAAIAKATGE